MGATIGEERSRDARSVRVPHTCCPRSCLRPTWSRTASKMPSGSHSHHLHLALAALAGALAAMASISAITAIQKRRRRRQLEDDIQSSLSDLSNSGELSSSRNISEEIAELIEKRVEPVVNRVSRGEDPEELFKEQLARCYALFKDEGMERIRKAKVVVVGCGGVGSWAAVMLVRS